MAEPAARLPGDEPDWPVRPWLLAALLGFAGLIEHFVTRGGTSPAQTALAVLVAVFALTLALTLQPRRQLWALAFAAIAGMVLAGIAWQIDIGHAGYSRDDYAFASGIVALLIAVPLFQAAQHAGNRHIAYPRVHFHAWNDVVTIGAALLFTGLTWLLLWLLVALFDLIKLGFLHTLMNQGWFEWTVSGAAFGAALGILREQETIIATLQRVVMLVLSVLALPLAIGLTVFLAALAVSGPQVLWQATRSATPVLMTCVVGAFVLVNAIIRDSDADASANRALRIAALVLALVMLPLALFAAFSTGLRIGQYGLSPDRMWAMAVVIVGCAYGVAYWVAVAQGRWAWAPLARTANLRLAIGVSVIAAVLALPLIDFGSIAARSQLARLGSGKVSAQKFDWQGLRWDFGPAGRRALRKLAVSGTPEQSLLARTALAEQNRHYLPRAPEDAAKLQANLDSSALAPIERAPLIAYLNTRSYLCRSRCVALDGGPGPGAARRIILLDGSSAEILHYDPAKATVAEAPYPAPTAAQLKPGDHVELRAVTRQQVFVNGQPVGDPLR